MLLTMTLYISRSSWESSMLQLPKQRKKTKLLGLLDHAEKKIAGKVSSNVDATCSISSPFMWTSRCLVPVVIENDYTHDYKLSFFGECFSVAQEVGITTRGIEVPLGGRKAVNPALLLTDLRSWSYTSASIWPKYTGLPKEENKRAEMSIADL